MTGGRFGAGLIGCVHQLTIQGEEVNLATDVQAAANVSPCTDYADSGSVARPAPPPAPAQYTWILCSLNLFQNLPIHFMKTLAYPSSVQAYFVMPLQVECQTTEITSDLKKCF